MLMMLMAGVCLGAAGHAILLPTTRPAHAQSAAAPSDSPTWEAEIDAIKGKLPDQAHAMQDVGYHFSSLWFAGERQNWDLAEFYWAETLSHLRWAIRIIPLRKDNAGRDVDVTAILEGFENGPLDHLHDAIAARDQAAFEKEYRVSLQACYDCHKAADKPFIRLQIPDRPETPIINFDPQADWPR
jgi:hypothetical protein